MVDRLTNNIRVRITISVYGTYTDKQHHGIIDDMLEIKWGIGIDK